MWCYAELLIKYIYICDYSQDYYLILTGYFHCVLILILAVTWCGLSVHYQAPAVYWNKSVYTKFLYNKFSIFNKAMYNFKGPANK